MKGKEKLQIPKLPKKLKFVKHPKFSDIFSFSRELLPEKLFVT